MRLILLFVLLTLIAAACDSDERDKARDSVVYFLVEEVEEVHGDSYLLPLKRPEDIEQARELIKSGEKKILLAEIDAKPISPSIANRDLKTGQNWSWYVSNFLGFADVTVEIYDGWPTYVEDNFDDWVNITKGENGKGRIGFWSYVISREVSSSEL